MTIPPKANKRPYPITMHGDTRVDDYYWLRMMSVLDADVLNYLQAENDFTNAVLQPQQTLRETPCIKRWFPASRHKKNPFPIFATLSLPKRVLSRVMNMLFYVRQPVWADSSWETLLMATNERQIVSFIPWRG